MSLGKRVKEYRVNNNIDQKELAKKLEVTQPYLSHLECGKVEASERLKNRILKIIENGPQETVETSEVDNVKSPKHYILEGLGIEVKDIIFGINQIIRRKIEEKYPKKDDIEDFIIYEIIAEKYLANIDYGDYDKINYSEVKFALEHRAYLWNPAPSTHGNKEREILATFKTRKENKEKEVENFSVD